MKAISAFSFVRAGLLIGIQLAAAHGAEAQLSNPPSANCHVTDGQFTACPTGPDEWSDVQPQAFPATNSFLYVNQNASHAFLYLLYDFVFRTSPVGAAQSVQVGFDTVEQGASGASLEHYDISIFGDGRLQVLVNGLAEDPGRIVGAVGFGASPNGATPHVIAELQVPLTPGAPTAYSPDPLFWSATVPPPPSSPPPSPPPDPCPTDPGKTYNRCVKAQLNNAQATAADMAAALGLAGGLCSTIGALACAPLEPGLLSLAAVWAVASAEFGRKLGADPPGVDFTVPPDSNFTVIPQPATYSLTLPTSGLTPEEAAAFNQLAANAQQLIALEQATTTALARVEGASLAGNTVWVNNQMQAARKFGGQAGVLISDLPRLLGNVGAAINAAGVRFTFTPVDALAFQAAIGPNAPPGEVQQQFALAQQLLAQQLGASSADQALVAQLLLSVDPQAVETLGTGAFPQALSDPLVATSLGQLGRGFVQTAPSLTSLTPSFQITLPGDYVASGVGLRGGRAPFFGPPLTTASISISGIPAAATVVRAFLYWGMLDNGLEDSLGQLSLNGSPVSGSLIGVGPDTCWGRSNSFTFRADVTPLVTGDGAYTLAGIATGGPILPEGASLVVVYQAAGLPEKTVMLADGNVSIPLGIATATTSFSGFSAADPVSAATTFIVGDGQAQQFGTTAVTFAGNLGTLSLPGLFSANDGPLWDTDTFDVSSVVGGSAGSATISLRSDCLLWSAQAFSIASAPVTTPITATAGVVQANLNGDTVINLRGLAPTDAPTIEDRIEMIVQSRIIQNPSTSASQLTTQLVNSLPPSILPPSEAAQIIDDVVKHVVVPLNLDTIPPVTTATVSPGPNGSGWNNTDVTVVLSSTDAEPNGSGVNHIAIALAGAQSGSTVAPGGTASVQINTEGVTTLTFAATDNAGNQEAPQSLTVRIDKTPPVISGMPAAGCTLWPPNHKFVQVSTLTASDAVSGPAPGTFTVTGTSNEPIAPTDPMNPDILITQTGPATFTVQLRAERLGTGTGRVYTLNASASDLAGNTATSTATCAVPHDQGH